MLVETCEIPMPAAMPCTLQRDKYREACRVDKACRPEYVCIVEADKSMRKRMEGSLHRDHEDHTAGKGMSPLSHYNLLHKFIPMPQAMKKPAVVKEQENWRKYRMAADESQKQKGGDRRSKE